jgi:hypothetical protein
MEIQTFHLYVTMGNDAMQTVPELADSLRLAADTVERGVNTHGFVFDANGNSVGEWHFESA